MNQEIRINSFYTDLLCQIARWIPPEHPAKESAREMEGLLSQGGRTVPTQSVLPLLPLLTDFLTQHPEERTAVLHLRKFFETALPGTEPR